MTDEPVGGVALEERFLANGSIQEVIGEARAHPERQVPRGDRSAEREALRAHESGE